MREPKCLEWDWSWKLWVEEVSDQKQPQVVWIDVNGVWDKTKEKTKQC